MGSEDAPLLPPSTTLTALPPFPLYVNIEDQHLQQPRPVRGCSERLIGAAKLAQRHHKHGQDGVEWVVEG